LPMQKVSPYEFTIFSSLGLVVGQALFYSFYICWKQGVFYFFVVELYK